MASTSSTAATTTIPSSPTTTAPSMTDAAALPTPLLPQIPIPNGYVVTLFMPHSFVPTLLRRAQQLDPDTVEARILEHVLPTSTLDNVGTEEEGREQGEEEEEEESFVSAEEGEVTSSEPYPAVASMLSTRRFSSSSTSSASTAPSMTDIEQPPRLPNAEIPWWQWRFIQWLLQYTPPTPQERALSRSLNQSASPTGQEEDDGTESDEEEISSSAEEEEDASETESINSDEEAADEGTDDLYYDPSDSTAPSTTDFGAPRQRPLVEQSRDASGVDHPPRSIAELIMRRWHPPATMRAGHEPLRNAYSTLVSISRKRKAESELTRSESKKRAKRNEEEIERNEADIPLSTDDEDSNAEVEEQVTSEARDPPQSLAQLNEGLTQLLHALRRSRTVKTPLPPSPAPSPPGSPTLSSTSFTTTPSTPSPTEPSSPRRPLPLLDETVARHIVSNIHTFRLAPWQEMLRTALESLVARGEAEIVYDILDEARRGCGIFGEGEGGDGRDEDVSGLSGDEEEEEEEEEEDEEGDDGIESDDNEATSSDSHTVNSHPSQATPVDFSVWPSKPAWVSAQPSSLSRTA